MGRLLRRALMQLQVRHVLLGVLGLISFIALGAVGWNAKLALQDLRTMHWLVRSNDVSEISIRLNAAAAMERGITSVLVAGSGFVRESGYQEMNRQRLAVDRYHAELVASTELLMTNRPDDSLKRCLQSLQAAWLQFLEARNAAARRIETEQTASISEWMEKANAYIESVAQVRRIALSSVSTLDHVSRENLLLKEVFYTVTEYAGRERAIIGSAVAAHRALTSRERETLKNYRAIVDVALLKIDRELEQLPFGDSLAAARAQMVGSFLGRFEQVRQNVYSASDQGMPYPVAPLEWYREATSAIETVLGLSEAVSRHMRTNISTVEERAHWLLTALFATCIVVVLAFGFTFFVLRHRILRPLNQLCRGGEKLGGGHLEMPLPRLESRDEFGFLRDVLESMRIHLNADIRRRERAEADLRKLASAVKQSTEAVVIADRNRIIEYVNPAFESMRGYRWEEVVGRTLDCLNAGSDGGEASNRLQAVFDEGDIFSATVLNRRKSGEPYYEETVVAPLREESGEITHLVMTGRDVTDRMQAQEQLRTLYRAIDQSVSSVIVTDPRGVTEYVNPQFTRTTGYSAEDVVGHKLNMIRSGDTSDETYGELWRTISAGEVWEGELLNRKKSGEVYWEFVSISPVLAEDGQITHFVGIQHDVTHRKAMEDRLNQLAYYDDQTGLANRALLRDRLNQTIAYAERKQSRFAVLFVDLDRFKLINDGLGHEAGDKVLRCVADRLRQWSRAADTVARQGGDEFVVIMLDVERTEDVPLAARRLLECIAKPMTVLGKELRITCSIGASLYPEDGTDAGALLRNADAAMYRAKQTGRNRVAFYTEDLNVHATERLALESELRRAIEQEEFVLFYQPQVSLVKHKVVGMEALVRWAHPDGLILPDRFLPTAEENGLIVPIGEWVLKEVCRQIRLWRDAGLAPVKVSVNVSARQLEHARLVNCLVAATEQAGISPELIELEITESMVMAHPADADDILAKLKSVGVTLALDDFGTGHSSLAHLRRFPFDKLKIDRSFVRHITTEPDDAAIATTITSMARALRLGVIAEGVETEEQACYLRRQGCGEVQGFLFSPPLPPDEASGWLDGRSLRLTCDTDRDPALLVVETDDAVLNAIKRVLGSELWPVITARNWEEAFAALASGEIAVVLAEQRLPEGSGAELAGKLKELYPKTVTVVLGSYADLAGAPSSGEEGGVYRYVTRPWNDQELVGVLYDAFVEYKQSKTTESLN